MKIRTQGFIAILLFIAILSSVLAAEILSSKWLEQTADREKLAGLISGAAEELGYLSQDYLIYRQSHQLDRWKSRFDSVSASLGKLHSDKPEYDALIRGIDTTRRRLGEVFENAISLPGKEHPDFDPALLQASWSRVAAHTQSLVSDANRLALLFRAEADSMKLIKMEIALGTIGAFVLFFLAGYLIFQRRILKGITILRAGTVVIGSGNLDYTIEERSNDEIGDLTKAFNKMVANLKGLTASKADLEVEIAERKRVEEALRKSEQRLESELDVALRLSDLSTMLVNSAEVKTIYDQMLDTAVSIMHADCASLQMLREYADKPENCGVLRLLACRGLHEESARFWDSVAVGTGSTCSAALRSFKRCIVPDIEQSEIPAGTLDLDEYRRSGIQAVQSTPLISRSGELIGMISTHWRRPYEPGASELHMFDILVRQISDLIERKRSEEAIRASEERFRALVNAGAYVIYRMSPDWTELRQLSGKSLISAVEPRNIDWLNEYIHPDDQPGVKAAVREAIRTKSVFEMEHRVFLSDGNLAWALSRAVPIIDENGEITEWFGAASDITARKQAQRQVEEERARLQAIIDTIPAGLLLIEPEGKVKFTNVEAIRIWAGVASMDRFSDYTAYKGYWPGTGEPLKAEEWPAAQALLYGKSTKDVVVDIEKFDGARGTIVLSGAPIKDGAGTVIGGVVTLQEVTHLRRMEEELRKSRDELELRVRERTVELERSNQALQEFAYIASHDLREPLRKVVSFGNMLRHKCSDSLGDTGSDYLARIINATQRMQNLISSLLEFSRVTTAPVQFEAVNLNEIVNGVLSDLEVRIARTGGRVTVEDLPDIYADPVQMRQLFQNLIGNALKFHKENEKPVVSIRYTRTEGKSYRIEVEDNGIGFDEEYYERIFAPFQRLHGKDEYEGTGMGLAICKKIVERHSGAISVKSKPGSGTTFTIEFPAPGNQSSPQAAAGAASPLTA